MDVLKQQISPGVLIKIFTQYCSISNPLNIYMKNNEIWMIIKVGKNGGLLSLDPKTNLITEITPIWESILIETLMNRKQKQ